MTLLAILPFFLLLFAALSMLVIHLVRPSFPYFWLVASLCTIAGWAVALFSGLHLPISLLLLAWKNEALFSSTPALLVDGISWPFALALSTLAVSILFTAVIHAQPSSWRAWAGSLSVIAFGMLAVLAANPLTLLLAWAALDMVEILFLLLAVYSSETRERVVAAFSARLGGIFLVLWAGITSLLSGTPLSFENLSTQSTPYLLVAAGLRLGVLPLNMPYLRELPLRRGFGVALRLSPAASSLMLLARTASVGLPSTLSPYLLLLTSLAAFYGAFSWAGEQDELAARPFWILATSALAVSAAIRGQVVASLAWGLACLLAGGLLFLASARHRLLLLILFGGLLGISSLPFTPTWRGAAIYLPGRTWIETLTIPIFFASQALLIAGYAHSIFKKDTPLPKAERWVWVISPPGLAILPVVFFLIGWRIRPDLRNIPLIEWLAGLVCLATAALIWAIGRQHNLTLAATGVWHRFFSLNWFYRVLWLAYRSFGRIIDLITLILEGESGILWALLLLALLFTIISRGGG